jgi:uncharacterized protein
MLKLLLLIGVIAAVYFLFFKKGTPLTKERNERNKESQKDEESTMVACESCGTYISTEEALMASGKFYCSEQCRDKA